MRRVNTVFNHNEYGTYNYHCALKGNYMVRGFFGGGGNLRLRVLRVWKLPTVYETQRRVSVFTRVRHTVFSEPRRFPFGTVG
jgi:hypothetical protein